MQRSNNRGSDGWIRHVNYACGWNGATRSKSTNLLRAQPNGKIFYNSKLKGEFKKDGKFMILVLNFEHKNTLLTLT